LTISAVTSGVTDGLGSGRGLRFLHRSE